MQYFDFGNYRIEITEKSDFYFGSFSYPKLEKDFFRCQQIHSALIYQRTPQWKKLSQGDGLFTDQVGVKLAVGVSDCNPVVIMGEQWFGIVHAGWRGLQGGIIQSLFEHLQEQGESVFRVFVGPSNRACCYEVGEEFIHFFDPQFLAPQGNGKYYFDMLGVMQTIFAQYFCLDVILHPECTHCGEHFFSYRRGDGINNIVTVQKLNAL